MSSTQQDAPPPYHRRNSNHDLQVPMSDVERMSMEDESRPLPEGWIRQFDPGNAHHFYVDTRATPPRSIWVHPLDDEQYRRENNLPPLSPLPPPSPKPGGSPSRLHKDEKAKLRDDEKSAATTASSSAGAGPSTQQPKDKEHERGFFGKMKDNLIGTKEEREERKRQKAKEEERIQREYLERRRILMEQARLHEQQRQQQYYALNGPLGRAGYQFGSAYAPPPGVYARRRGRGGVGLPLLGGLAGGLLLGEALDGFDGGGFGGGDFGGGDFGGDF